MTGTKEFKYCKTCGESKSVIDFYRRSNGYLSSLCKPCTSIANNSQRNERRRAEREARAALPVSEVKVCSQCSATKSRAEFYGRQAECKECSRVRNAEYKRRPDVRKRTSELQVEYALTNRARTRVKNLARYGMSPDEYDEMFDTQHGLCAICGRAGSRLGTGGAATRYTVLCVDHDHQTGNVRGLLCAPCNRGIGLLGESRDVLVSAITYLKLRS